MHIGTAKNPNIIYKELSFRINGILYDAFNKLGYGYQEKYYKNALAADFDEEKIGYQRELYVPLVYGGKKIGHYFLDFLVENIIVLEVKIGNRISHKDIEQVYAYLKSKNLKLGIIARFTSKGVVIKRIVNLR